MGGLLNKKLKSSLFFVVSYTKNGVFQPNFIPSQIKNVNVKKKFKSIACPSRQAITFIKEAKVCTTKV